MHTKSLVVLAILLLFAAVRCDKENWRFTTPNRFDVDASAHQLEVGTSIGTLINFVRINERKEFELFSMPRAESKPIRIPAEADSCCVYLNVNNPTNLADTIEVIGGWFSIMDTGELKHIRIDENDSGRNRDLVIKVRGKVIGGDIVIHQKKK